MKNPNVKLEDKYALLEGETFLTGIQALVRLPLDQKRRDRAAGRDTAGFISGYRGSPLGGYDQQLWRAKSFLDSHDVLFEPGLNEDLGATAVWGTQQTAVFPGATREGVFGLWYGKAPGVDRCGDVFKHANAAGTSALGGVLAVAGDDHACKSSTLPSQSEFALMDAEMPVLSPADVQEVLDYGLYGWALSRHSGMWVGLIALADTMDSAGVVEVGPHRARLAELAPALDVHIRQRDWPPAKEARLRLQKRPAALDFSRANKLDRVVLGRPDAQFGLVVAGKAYLDTLEALRLLGLSPREAEERGFVIYKVAMPWPLEPEGSRAFALDRTKLMVVEHKRSLIETQIRDALYHLPDGHRPQVVGKVDVEGRPLLSDLKELSPVQIACAIARELPDAMRWEGLKDRIAELERREKALETLTPRAIRMPYYCSGCPHNTSTKVPDGSRALAGIGCHYLATFMDRDTDMASHMGGEGVAWIGHAPFTSEKHVFVNLGDGTYAHSGLLAIRAAVAAKANITYKILYNDAVAMTGGQPAEGAFTAPEICRQLRAERVDRIVIVTDRLVDYDGAARNGLPTGVDIRDRKDMDAIQREFRDIEGVSAIVYDQTCATEKRRRRKRGLMPAATRRAYINPRVCEGCGDCSKQSNCLSVEPIATPFGAKRRINQASCNVDLSCVNGFCPSFVTVEGPDVAPAKSARTELPSSDAPLPEPPARPTEADMLVAGVGGMGVTTVAAVLGMAAHLEGKHAKTLDMTGLAQKGGAVLSHLRIAASPIHAPRVPPFGADVLLGGDIVVAASNDTAHYVSEARTRAVLNADMAPTAELFADPRKTWDQAGLVRDASGRCKDAAVISAAALAARHFGDGVFVNVILLGHAYQQGLVPLGADAIERAFELNGAAVKANVAAFRFGRRLAHEGVPETAENAASEPLETLVARLAGDLTAYQDRAYADRFRSLVEAAGAAERRADPSSDAFTATVARFAHKLMAYKDEYEVARLYGDPAYWAELRNAFEGVKRVKIHLAPPLIARKDPRTGELQKRPFGPWVFHVFRVLRHMKSLRGGPFDVFGRTEERRMERRLRDDYEATIRGLLGDMTGERLNEATAIAALPDLIRGFGHVKARNVATYDAAMSKALADWRAPRTTPQEGHRVAA